VIIDLSRRSHDIHLRLRLHTLLNIFDRLMSRGEDNLTPEEPKLLELLVQLIECFEEKAYPIPESPGYRVLQTPMKNRGVKQADLPPIFGSRGIASEIYNCKRAISKAGAKKLDEFFGVSPAVFF